MSAGAIKIKHVAARFAKWSLYRSRKQPGILLVEQLIRLRRAVLRPRKTICIFVKSPKAGIHI
jgi:hypothetical protein